MSQAECIVYKAQFKDELLKSGAPEPYDGKLSRTVLRGGKLERAYLSNQRLKPYQFLYGFIVCIFLFSFAASFAKRPASHDSFIARFWRRTECECCCLHCLARFWRSELCCWAPPWPEAQLRQSRFCARSALPSAWQAERSCWPHSVLLAWRSQAKAARALRASSSARALLLLRARFFCCVLLRFFYVTVIL